MFFSSYILGCENNHYHHFNTFKEFYGRLCWAINKLLPKILPATEHSERKKMKTRSCPFNNNVYHIKMYPKLIHNTHTYTHTYIHQTSIILIYCSKHDGSDLFCIIITYINQVRKRLKVPPLFEKECKKSLCYFYYYIFVGAVCVVEVRLN